MLWPRWTSRYIKCLSLEVLLCRMIWKEVFLWQMPSLVSLPFLFNIRSLSLCSWSCQEYYVLFQFINVAVLFIFFLGTVSLPANTHPCGLFAFNLPVQSHRMCTEKTNCRDKLVLDVHDWSRAKYLNFRCLQRDFSLTSAFKRKIIKYYHYFRSELYCFWSKAVVRFTK